MTCLVKINHFVFGYTVLGHLNGYIMSCFIMSQSMIEYDIGELLHAVC